MFDFLKKSYVAKFLCSACLICSLGSFAMTNIAHSVVSMLSTEAGDCVYMDDLCWDPLHLELKGTFKTESGSAVEINAITSPNASNESLGTVALGNGITTTIPGNAPKTTVWKIEQDGSFTAKFESAPSAGSYGVYLDSDNCPEFTVSGS